MEQKTLYLLENYDIYERMNNSEVIIFYSKNEDEEDEEDEFEKVMRFAFLSDQKSMFNEENTGKESYSLKVFRFHEIGNYFSSVSGKKYEKYVNQGYMTASFCYLILQLLHDKRLAEIDFEINLVNRAIVRESGSSTLKPDIYNKLLGEHSKTSSEDEYKVFWVANRAKDIKYYQELFDRKKIQIKSSLNS
ncbi:hypothetical protein [Streptococcus anginosus]|uniref:hypothetical protein n=1 Tax=Streptococcus anginosus TaxID=1328 RepID=UPI0020005C86|nr:hypothetical protein [Streptococcus anginosus]